ncbi:MAG TPA: lipopolysaccharide kinase InaA family protein [Gemmataceae bacterium]|nr:lipopolysaccharide kinase InaA family protein [Gemmataceae bacterium]
MPANTLTLPRTAKTTSRLIVHPQCGKRLAEMGLDRAEAILDLPGEIVSGHPDRHVIRIALPGWECGLFLKREHRVGWRERLRQWLAGFGWTSRCEREARILRDLEAAGFPVPGWVAHGEDGQGRAFLLLEKLSAAIELRHFLGESQVSLEDRRRLAERFGQAVAELHAAGFTTPDLTAKHVFVNPHSLAVTLIDWQNARRGVADRTGSLAALHASLADHLADVRDRLRFLWAYRRVTRQAGRTAARFSRLVRDIIREAARIARRRSIRDQRQPIVTGVEQRLVWLAGEAVCAVPDVAAIWPNPPVTAPFYGAGPSGTGGQAAYVLLAGFRGTGLQTCAATRTGLETCATREGGEFLIELPDGRPAVLVRGRSLAPLGRCVAWLRGRSWRSPGVTLGRVLFHLQRYSIPAPRLFAFGQRETRRASADWFALYEPPAGRPVGRQDLKACLELLRQLHDAGCRPDLRCEVPFRIDSGRAVVGDPWLIRIVRRMSGRERRADFRRLVHTLRAR